MIGVATSAGARDKYEARLRSMVTAASGIQLPATKRHLIESRLRKRVRALGLETLDDYFIQLFEDGILKDEMPFIIDLLSTNKTDFFREPAHFTFLMKHILPAHPVHKPFKLWSAASSTGAEAYTCAMLLSEFAARVSDFKFGILGTDISPTVLETARNAVYSESEFKEIPDQFRQKYIQMGQTPKGKPVGRIDEKLRKRTRFARLNLIDPPYPVDRDIDVVFLRNVLIYFDDETQCQVISSTTDHLKPGGYLFVGHSESMTVKDPRLAQRSSAVYQKVS